MEAAHKGKKLRANCPGHAHSLTVEPLESMEFRASKGTPTAPAR